jgi:hypothetical protein
MARMRERAFRRTGGMLRSLFRSPERRCQMPTRLMLPLLLVFLAGIVVLAQPFASMGNGIGPGFADLLNGGAALALFLLAAIAALIGRSRARRPS